MNVVPSESSPGPVLILRGLRALNSKSCFCGEPNVNFSIFVLASVVPADGSGNFHENVVLVELASPKPKVVVVDAMGAEAVVVVLTAGMPKENLNPGVSRFI